MIKIFQYSIILGLIFTVVSQIYHEKWSYIGLLGEIILISLSIWALTDKNQKNQLLVLIFGAIAFGLLSYSLS